MVLKDKIRPLNLGSVTASQAWIDPSHEPRGGKFVPARPDRPLALNLHTDVPDDNPEFSWERWSLLLRAHHRSPQNNPEQGEKSPLPKHPDGQDNHEPALKLVVQARPGFHIETLMIAGIYPLAMSLHRCILIR